MTAGNPIRLILAFAIPLFIGNIFQQIYGVADTMIAGHALGDGAIAAIGATSSVYSLLIDLASGLNSGYGIVVSRYFGAKDPDGLKRSIAAMIVLDIAVTLCLTFLSLALIGPLLQIMRVPSRIFHEARQYISIILGGMLATILYNMCAGILRAVGNSKTPLYFLILSCSLNLGLDALFIMKLGWGLPGAAAATVIAQSVSALLCGGYIGWKYRDILPGRAHIRLKWPIVKEMSSTGFAMAAMLCAVDLGSILYQRSINGLGQAIIVAHTAARKLIGVLMMPLASIATANSTFVGQNWGARQYERIRQSLKKVLILEAAWGAVSCLFILQFGKEAVQILTSTADPAVLSNAVLSLRTHFICFPALGILLALRTTMQAMGQRLIPVLSSTLEMAVKVAAGLWFIPLFGYVTVCFAEPVIWNACMVFLLVVFAVKKPLQEAAKQSNAPTGGLPVPKGAGCSRALPAPLRPEE